MTGFELQRPTLVSESTTPPQTEPKATTLYHCILNTLEIGTGFLTSQ